MHRLNQSYKYLQSSLLRFRYLHREHVLLLKALHQNEHSTNDRQDEYHCYLNLKKLKHPVLIHRQYMLMYIVYRLYR